METTTNYNIKMRKLPKAQLEISATVPTEIFDNYHKKALENIGKDIELPGFRKGHVPEKMLESRIGEAAILEEMAELAISRAYAEILISEKIDALGKPEVRITKIAKGNPLEFTITTAIFPEVILADYKKIAIKLTDKKNAILVSDEELEKTLGEIKKMRGKNEAQASGKEFDETMILPELTDDFVKTLGDYQDVPHFTSRLKEDIRGQKERDARDKVRVAIMEELVTKSTVELPEIIIDQELLRMEDEFAHEIERMGMKFDDYIKATGKSKEDMQKEWLPDAEKRAKVQLIASKIAETEKIHPTKEEIESEIKMLRVQYPNASEERMASYIEMLLTNEMVFKFLEQPVS